MDSGRWTDRQKIPENCPRVAPVKKGKSVVKHPGRHLMEPLTSTAVFRAKFREVENDGLRFFIERGKCALLLVFFRGD